MEGGGGGGEGEGARQGAGVGLVLSTAYKEGIMWNYARHISNIGIKGCTHPRVSDWSRGPRYAVSSTGVFDHMPY
jgi:hypothetical protein